MLELVQGFLIALDIHEHVMRLVHLGDGEGHLTPAPVLEAVDRTLAGGDGAAVALDHCGHLLALIGMDDEYDFVMTHAVSLWVKPPVMRSGEARWAGPPNSPAIGEARDYKGKAPSSANISQAPPIERLRRDSNKMTPLATETLRLSTCPNMGILTSWSQVSRVRRRMPSPSAPSTHARAAGSRAE